MSDIIVGRVVVVRGWGGMADPIANVMPGVARGATGRADGMPDAAVGPSDASPLAIAVASRSYSLPVVAEGDPAWVLQQLARAGERLMDRAATDVERLIAARQYVDALRVTPATLVAFQQQYPDAWENLSGVLMGMAHLLHRAAGPNGRLPHYAVGVKEFLKRWVVVEADGRAYTYRAEPIERDWDGAVQSAACDAIWVRMDGPRPAQEVFEPRAIYAELVGELRRAVEHPDRPTCYRTRAPRDGLPTVEAADQTVGEQEPVALTATVTSSGYRLHDTTWEQITQPGAPVVPPAFRNNRWEIATPPVVADGLPLTYRVTVADELGREITDTATITVNNTINEAPTVTIRGPKQGKGGQTLKLTAKAADPNPGEALTYQWRVVAGPAVSLRPNRNGTAADVTLPAVIAPTSVVVACTVTDPHGATAIAKRAITIAPPPVPPPTPAPPVADDFPALERRYVRSGNEHALRKIRQLAQLGPVYGLTAEQQQAGVSVADRVAAALQLAQPVQHHTAVLVVDQSGSMDDNIQNIHDESGKVATTIIAGAAESTLALHSFVDEQFPVWWGLAEGETITDDLRGVADGLATIVRQLNGGLEYIAESDALRPGDSSTPGVSRHLSPYIHRPCCALL